MTGKKSILTPPDLTHNKGDFHVHSTNQDQVQRLIKNLKTNSATGHDLIPCKYIKPIAHIIAPPT